MMSNIAHFTYYGPTEEDNKNVEFYKNSNGMYVCRFEGYPALTIIHPSHERVKAAFKSWYERAQRDWGASEINWKE